MLIELHELDPSDDPVRPELSSHWRIAKGRRIFSLADRSATICLAFCNRVPESLAEMERGSTPDGRICVGYTIWSNRPGSGRALMDGLRSWAMDNKKIERLITLSPLTKMAERFHLRNGANLLNEHEEAQNFEYSLERL